MHTLRRFTPALALAIAAALAACTDAILSEPDVSAPAAVAPPQGPSLDDVPPDTTSRCTGQAGSSPGRC